MKSTPIVLAIAGLGAACVSLAVVMVVVSSRRILTPLEASLLQIVILAAGLVGSYLFGQRFANVNNARSAFRRVVRLYASLSRLAVRIQEFRATDEVDKSQALDVIEAIVQEQIPSGADALEDWRDIVPKDVEEVQNRLNENASVEDLIR